MQEGRNSFTSPTLVMRDLDNSAGFSANGKSLSVGTSAGDYSASIGQEGQSKQSTTKSGISGIAGDTEVRTGKDSTNALTPIDKEKLMRQVGAQVEIPRSASELAIRMSPQAIELLVGAIERLIYGLVQNIVTMGPSSPPVPGATPGERTKGRSTIWKKPGDMGDANRDFDDLKPVDVQNLGDGGRVGTLPDGRTLVVRPDSTDGRPTLEFQDGKKRVKVRYSS